MSPDELCEKGFRKFSWWQDWRGECVAIVGGGASAKSAGVEKLRDRIHVVVINESYRLCPWAELLYSCDIEWWKLRYSDLKKFSGIKLTNEYSRKHYKMDINTIKIATKKKDNVNWFVDDYVFDEPGVIGAGMNSGFQTKNIVAQFGVSGILLVGFDMNMLGGLHWHGKHPYPLRNPDEGRFEVWPKAMDACAPKLMERGIEVVNCSPTSSLKAYKKFTIEEALERWSL